MSRATLLHHPVFTGSVALLAVNDVWLKDRYPGLITGKLSDFAGVMVIAIALTVALGAPRIAAATTAIGFTALKLSPTVATAAAPILGGVTRTDATDLIALTALVPLVAWLEVRNLRTLWTVAAPTATTGFTLVMVALATATTTATSCETVPAVVAFAASGDAVWAQMFYEDAYTTDNPGWAVSEDGGRTWRPDERGPRSGANRGGPQACIDDDCWRVIPDRSIQLRMGGDWRDSFRFTTEEIERIEFGNQGFCRQASTPWFGELIVLNRPTSHVLVSMGSQGILRFDGDQWHRVGVLDADPTAIGGPLWRARLSLAAFALLLVAPVFGLVGVVLRRRDPSRDWLAGAYTAGASAVALLFLLFVFTFHEGDERLAGPVIAGLSVVMFVVSVLRMRTRTKRRAQTPPPPDLQPPSPFGPPTGPRH